MGEKALALIDIRTMLLSSLLNITMCTLVIGVLYAQNRQRFGGLGTILVGAWMHVLGTLLIGLRGSIPDLLSIWASNTMLALGVALIHSGFRQMMGKKADNYPDYVLLGVFSLAYAYYTFSDNNLAVRTLLLGVYQLIVSSELALFLLAGIPKHLMRAARVAGITYVGYASVNAVRIVAYFASYRPSNDFLQAGTWEAYVVLSYQMLFILMTYGLILLVNMRLKEEIGSHEDKYNKAFITSPYSIVLTNVEKGIGKIIEANEAFYKMTGYAPAEVIGKSTEELNLWYTNEERQKVVAELDHKGTIDNMEIWFRKKSGEKALGLMSSRVFQSQGRTIALSSINDITHRRKEEEELNEARGRFKVFFEDSIVPMSITYMDGRMRTNKAFIDALGYSEEEFRLLKWQEITHEEDIALSETKIKPILEGKVDSTRFVKRYIRKDGGIIWVDISTIIKRSDDGKPAYYQTAFVDITEMKRAEDARVESEARYQALFEHMASASCLDQVVYSDGKAIDYVILDINPAFEKVVGVKRADVVGKLASEAYGTKDIPFFDEFVSVAETGEPIRFEALNPVLDKFLDYTVSSPAKGYFSTMFTDVTEKRKAEAKRLELEEQIRRQQRFEIVGQLAAGISHDFNNLLTGIEGFTKFAYDAAPYDSTIKEDLKEVLTLTQRAASITGQLLAFSRKQTLQTDVVELNLLISETVRVMQQLIGENIELSFKPQENLGSIRADYSRIQQVLMNLVINARDAMPEGGMLTIETSEEEVGDDYIDSHIGLQKGQYVMMSVSDNGCGMDSDVRAHLFEPFFTTKGVGKGTGLGLSTAYGIVKQHNGDIRAYSEPGLGSTFRVYLPSVKEKYVDKPAAKVSDMRAGNETILILEDEEAVREITARNLRKMGYRVLTAALPSIARSIITEEESEVKLLLTDVVMPEMSGKQFYEQARVDHPHLKVLYMSGYTSDLMSQKGVLEENSNFIQKPFTAFALGEKIREVLGS